MYQGDGETVPRIACFNMYKYSYIFYVATFSVTSTILFDIMQFADLYLDYPASTFVGLLLLVGGCGFEKCVSVSVCSTSSKFTLVT